MDNLPQAVANLDNSTPTVDDPILIDVKAVAAYDGNGVCGQFDNSADTTVTNLLIYLHNYKPCNCQFKCPVWLTGDDSSNDVCSLGKGKLRVPADVSSVYLVICCFY